MPPKRKIKSSEFVDDSDDPDGTRSKPKKTKVAGASASAATSDEEMIPLSAKRFVSVQTFRGKQLVSIREYYDDQDSGERRPGKKGISLSIEQWEKLKEAVPKIDEQIRDKV